MEIKLYYKFFLRPLVKPMNPFSLFTSYKYVKSLRYIIQSRVKYILLSVRRRKCIQAATNPFRIHHVMRNSPPWWTCKKTWINMWAEKCVEICPCLCNSPSSTPPWAHATCLKESLFTCVWRARVKGYLLCDMPEGGVDGKGREKEECLF